MNKKLSALLASLVIGGTLSLTIPLLHAQQSTNSTSGTPRIEKMPLMHAALQDLEHAKIKLGAAPHIYGGHRDAAIKAVDEAIREVKAGIKFAEEKH